MLGRRPATAVSLCFICYCCYVFISAPGLGELESNGTEIRAGHVNANKELAFPFRVTAQTKLLGYG
ncbi:hypothetical protein GQ55_3G105500 [Panicum hallii var. hallii]|uniref:Uncharacterized protein n=1 Tax=Panicum hallii var. hallii TaxID=1504633 RepID=A0A2T7E7Z5_9POAL|nr:hypothetical protein GQ55_3G105500 [Panicum hallii var. hallii]